MTYWLLLEKSDETRVSKSIDSYRDATGEFYHYDSLVPNHLNVAMGDHAIFRKENVIVGFGRIGNISVIPDSKLHRRCPECRSTDIRERATKIPKWKCGKCRELFVTPNNTVVAVRSFMAEIRDFTKINNPPTVKDVKMCATSVAGASSQLSMLRLDDRKVRTLLGGIDPDSANSALPTGSREQGFGLSQDERRVVETYAMQVARDLYEKSGWDVVDVSLSQPFDLLARKGRYNRFIEVKGTTGAGQSVILTHGEVNHARKNSELSALVVVSGIVLENLQNGLRAKGGSVTTHNDPWKLVDTRLIPTQYRYEVS